MRCLWLLVIALLPFAAGTGPWHAWMHAAAEQPLAHATSDEPRQEHRDSRAPTDGDRDCPICHLLHMPMTVTPPMALPIMADRAGVIDQRVVSLHTLTVAHQHSGRAPPVSHFA